jgi:GNAT superfamily N-acetyltransferase
MDAMRDRTAQINIRGYRQGPDDSFVLTLGERAFAPYSRASRASIISMINEPGAEVAVAEIGRAKAGFAIVAFTRLPRDFGPWKSPAVARLNAIAVRPESRGRGVGRGLVAWAEEIARAQGAVSLTLTTAETNLDAQQLFEHAGFLPVTRLFETYAGGQTGVAMFKAL